MEGIIVLGTLKVIITHQQKIVMNANEALI
jgi:hypothetical protein